MDSQDKTKISLESLQAKGAEKIKTRSRAPSQAVDKLMPPNAGTPDRRMTKSPRGSEKGNSN